MRTENGVCKELIEWLKVFLYLLFVSLYSFPIVWVAIATNYSYAGKRSQELFLKKVSVGSTSSLFVRAHFATRIEREEKDCPDVWIYPLDIAMKSVARNEFLN